LPEAHCASLVQAEGQEAPPPPHTYGAQVGLPVLPSGKAEQVPTLPGRAQESQAPPHAALQQTPSTHWPLPHWLVAEQLAPLDSLGAHWPALQ
jgi:hypothetical protein